MARAFCLIVVLFMAQLALVTVVTTAEAQDCALPAGASGLSDAAGAIMNAERAREGLGEVVRHPQLDAAAALQACHVSSSGDFSHDGPGGNSVKDRALGAGYRACLIAENLAWGQSSGAEVIAAWMDSRGHRRNMLERRVEHYGLALSAMDGRPVWVLVLGRPC